MGCDGSCPDGRYCPEHGDLSTDSFSEQTLDFATVTPVGMEPSPRVEWPNHKDDPCEGCGHRRWVHSSVLPGVCLWAGEIMSGGPNIRCKCPWYGATETEIDLLALIGD